MCGTNRFDIPEDLSVAEVAEFGASERPTFTADEAAFIAEATRAYSTLGDQLHTLADKVEDLTRERDEALDEVNRLEAELNDVEQDKLDLDTIDSELRTAESELSGLFSELSSVKDKVDNLRYVDLEDVMGEIDTLSSDLYDVEAAAQLVETAVADARTELERS